MVSSFRLSFFFFFFFFFLLAMLKRVEELNPGINTNNLRPGKTIKLPRSAE